MVNKHKLTYYTIFNNKGVDMRKLLLVLFLGVVLSPLSLLAANTGTLKGRVVLEDKNPASGATLRIVGTNSGTKAKTDGKFTMVAVSVGAIQLKVSYLGAEKTINLSLSANEIKDLGDIEIRQEKTTDVVEVIADKIDLSRTSSSSVISGAQMQNNAREGLTSIVNATAGVQASTDGYSIRGSRPNESSIRLDGVEVSNPLNGGFGSGGTSYFPMPSTLGVAEVQVITGGFSAEYGEAMGGVVNTSMEVGSTEKYRGALKWRTAVNPLWGSQGAKLGIKEEDGILKAFNDGDGYKREASNAHSFDFAVNGPIPFTDKRGTFAISSSYQVSDGTGGYDRTDVLGDKMIGFDHNNSWIKRLDARFKYDVTNSLSVVLGSSFGLSSRENNDRTWSYATGLGVANTENLQGSIANNFVGVQENLAKQNVQNTKVMNLLARVKQVFENNSFYIFTLSYNQNNDDNGRRINMDDPGFLSGFEILEPQDSYTTVAGANGILNTVSGRDMIEDHYKKYMQAGVSKDGYFAAEFPVINPFTGFYEGDESKTTNNPYGYYSNMFDKHSSYGGFEYRRTNYWQADGSYEIIIDDDKFKHAIKSGFEFRSYELHKHSNSTPWSDVSGFDVFTDKWGGNLYIPEQYTDAIAKTSKPYEPIRGSMYVQDQISYKGIVFTPGLRVDYFDPNSDYRTRTLTFTRVIDEGFEKVDPKIYVSPRMFVTYPLTETSKLDMSYGLFLKTPELQYMYDGFGTWYPSQGMVIGNPDMKAQRSSQYQIAYENQLTDELGLTVTAYYKDIYNQLGTIYAQAAPVPFYIYSTSEYGSSKGIEFMIEKREMDNIYANVNYSLASNKGTSPGPSSNVGRPVDPYTDKLAFPLAEFAMDNDIRHTLNFTLNFFWLNNEGVELFGVQPLENASINFSGSFSSGSPYTRTKRSGEPISDYNEVRQPSYWQLDLRFKKAFQLADFFGESAGNTSIEFFVDVNNLLNRTVPIALNSITADPDDNGNSFYTLVTDMTTTTFYKEVNYVLASTFNSSQYDSYGDRLYTVRGDHNLDGVITREEQYESYKNYLKDALSARSNYQAPRTVYFGILFNF